MMGLNHTNRTTVILLQSGLLKGMFKPRLLLITVRCKLIVAHKPTHHLNMNILLRTCTCSN